MNNKDLIVVGIGASAGGLDALKSFLHHLPPNLPAAYVIITHLLRNQESKLADILRKHTAMPVIKVSGITHVAASSVYVMPENVVLRFKHGFLVPAEREQGMLANKAIDEFLESIARSKRERAVGVILSGMGSDGARGAEVIYEHGGSVLVQDPSSAQFSSMPWATIHRDHPDEILPPSKLAKAVARLITEKTPVIAADRKHANRI